MFKLFLSGFILLLTSFNTKQPALKVEKIEFSSNGCFGKCPVWKLTINNDKTVVLNAEKFNKTNGSFKTEISEEEYNKLIELISSLNNISPKPFYNSGRTCGLVHELKAYAEGKVINTRSMHLSGPKEVQELFKALIDLREKTSWEEVSPQ